MKDLIESILGAPVSTVLVLAGLAFLIIAVVGNISGKITTDKPGRIVSGVVGAILIVIGIAMQPPSQPSSKSPAQSTTTPSQVSLSAATSMLPTLTLMPPTHTLTPVPSTNTPPLVPATDTATATSAPVPTNTPTSTPRPALPTSTATVAACALPAADWLQTKFTQDSSLRGLVGCPANSAYSLNMGEEPFQNGLMIWREDTRKIYVLLNTGVWLAYDDTWDATQREGGYYTAPSGLREPRRGFGKVWREKMGGPSGALGWALEDERPVSGQAQDFTKGLTLRNDRADVRVLLLGGNWR